MLLSLSKDGKEVKNSLSMMDTPHLSYKDLGLKQEAYLRNASGEYFEKFIQMSICPHGGINFIVWVKGQTSLMSLRHIVLKQV